MLTYLNVVKSRTANKAINAYTVTLCLNGKLLRLILARFSESAVQ